MPLFTRFWFTYNLHVHTCTYMSVASLIYVHLLFTLEQALSAREEMSKFDNYNPQCNMCIATKSFNVFLERKVPKRLPLSPALSKSSPRRIYTKKCNLGMEKIAVTVGDLSLQKNIQDTTIKFLIPLIINSRQEIFSFI